MKDTEGFQKLPIRLALRHEGTMWNAYLAKESSMVGSILIGCICMAAVIDNEQRKDEFIELMQGIVTDFLEENLGLRPTMGDPEAAPERDRSGNA